MAFLPLFFAGTTSHAQETLVLSQAECRAMALEYNEELQRADNLLQQAEIDKAVAFKAYLPKFDGTASSLYMNDLDMMGMELRMQGMYMAGVSLTQPLYAGGKIRAANKLAGIGKDCAEEKLRKTRMQVMADADNAYWTFISVQWKVKMLQAYMRQMEALYAQVQTAVGAGMSTESDLLRVDAKRNDISYQLQKAVNGANLCRLSLCDVLGCPLDTQINPTDTLITVTPPTRLDESIDARPELRLLQKQVESARQQVRMARADMLPQIGLSAAYTYYGNVKLKGMAADAAGNYQPYTRKFEDGIGLVMASVSIPIFHWGENLKKVKKAKLDVANARLDLQKNTRLLSIEVRQAVQNVTDGYRLVETAQMGCRQADENLRVQNDRYRNGMCTLTDLLDVQSQWQQSQSHLIEAQTQQKIYETEYMRVTGRL